MTLAVLGSAGLTFAQTTDPSPSQFEDLIEVSEVLLDVLVTDRDGNVVVDLKPEDFVVEDDGEERQITGASFYSNRFAVETATREGQLLKPAVPEVLSDRYFILFFHDSRRFDDPGRRIYRRQLDAIRKAKRWVKEEMLGGDWVAVASYDVRLQVYSDFTQSRDELQSALDKLSRGKDAANIWPSRRPDQEEIAGRPSLLIHLPEGKELRDQTTRIYDGLSLVAEATRDIVGRKNMMLFTAGFGEVERVAGAGFGALTSRPDERFYPGLEQSLNDNNVAVYPIDLVPIEFEHAQTDFLNLLAADSGGDYYFNFVNFITPMREVADEASGYYLLSYLAEHKAGEVGYRDIKIETRNDDFRVRARRGYRFGS
ncbi:MAG: VWA domain-containing protein [Acidobacteriota bacterium]